MSRMTYSLGNYAAKGVKNGMHRVRSPLSSVAQLKEVPINGTAHVLPLPNMNGLHLNDPIYAGAKAKINSNFHGLEISPTLGINEMQNLLQSDDRDVYKFGFGQSPMPVPNCLVNKLIQYAQAKDYLPVQGLYPLRESISCHFNKHILQRHKDITPNRIIITPGTKQAFFLLKLALSECSEVLLPSPSWVSYHPQSQMLGRNVVWLNTTIQSHWKILPHKLDKYLAQSAYKQRLLILNSPSNPTGVKYSYDELSMIAHICRKYSVFVLSDEIYGDLYHDENDSYYSMYDVYPENTMITNGLSKSFGAGGWRLGFIIFPSSMQLLDPVFIAASETHTSVSAPIQYAAMEAFDGYEGDEIQRYLMIKRKILKALSCKTYGLLRDIEGCRVIKPDGGFYIFPDFSNVKNINNMRRKWMRESGKSKDEWNAHECSMFLLKECGVAVLCGSHFGRDKKELSMRLSYVDFDGTNVLNDLNMNRFHEIAVDSVEMDDILNRYCYKTVKGMQILHDYMSSL